MVKIGVVGAGKWGINHLRIFSELDCELVGLADSDNEKREIANKYKIKFFTNYKELLPLVDAVSVVVPTNLHFGVVKECLLAGKHVLVEKPITLNSNEAKKLIELAKKKNLILAVGYLFRFNAAVLALKGELKKIGDIQYITARYIHSNKPPRKDCGVVFNFAIHLIDILNFILDEKPKRVFCKKLNYLSEEREDCAFIILDYGKFIANMEVSWFHPLKKRDMWIIGSKEKVYIDLFEQIIKKYPIEVSYDKVSLLKEYEVKVNKNEPLEEELKKFCDCIKNNMITNVGEEELITTKICELCLKSAKENKELEL
ncbi:Gfo/Idh/MocA family oxidoreductase [Candidatus Woesearchaeota archaeon]|nr:Gfo/Idh/MocA family oxidoreductase [Candidatus Woesearchaeota archaeon]